MYVYLKITLYTYVFNSLFMYECEINSFFQLLPILLDSRRGLHVEGVAIDSRWVRDSGPCFHLRLRAVSRPPPL